MQPPTTSQKPAGESQNEGETQDGETQGEGDQLSEPVAQEEWVVL